MAYLGLNNLPQFNPANTPWAQGVDMYQNLQQFPLLQQQRQLANQQQQIANQYAPQVNQANIAQTQAQANILGLQAKYPLMYSSNPILSLLGTQQYMKDNPGQPPPVNSSNVNNNQPAPQVSNNFQAGMQLPNTSNTQNSMGLPSGLDMNKLMQMALLNQYGSGLTGPAADAYSVAKAQQLFGNNSPIAQNANQLFNAQVSSLENRSVPDIVKAQNALSQIQDQGSPQAQQLKNYISKQSSTPANLQRATMAQAVSQGLTNIPVDAIVKYAGPAGQAQLGHDHLTNIMTLGKGAPDSYNQYQAFINNLPALKDQFTKFMGGSISEDAMKALDPVFNPTTWRSNPKVALMSLQKLQDMFNSENQVFSKASSMDYNPIEIQGLKEAQAQQNQPNQTSNATASFVQLQAPNGKIYNVPSDQINKYMKLGGKRV